MAFGPVVERTQSIIEEVIARAIEGAVAAGRWDIVAQLARELEARGLDETRTHARPGGLDILLEEYTIQSMWAIVEARDAAKALDKLPRHVGEKYAFWCAIVRQSGPVGLRAIKSFHDEKLSGSLSNRRSSRLSQQWRVLYHVDAETVTVYVDRITAHDYRL